jgi:hypothetical protein
MAFRRRLAVAYFDISALAINYASRPARLTRLNDGTYTQQERELT